MADEAGKSSKTRKREKNVSLTDTRNIGIMAHIDAGKTTTTERILYYAGKEHRLGGVDEGTATMDYLEEEQERGITITSAATTVFWESAIDGGRYRINIIDTPGHVDFTAEVERSLRVLDAAVAVFDAAHGVEAQSETVWRQAERYGIPRISFINKMDKVGADFDKAVASIEKKLGARTLCVQIPIGAAESFAGVIDLVEMRVLTFDVGSLGKEMLVSSIPAGYADEAAVAREKMLEALADADDDFAEKYLEKPETISPGDIRRALRLGTVTCAFYPVLCGAALRNIGVQPVIEAVCHYFPSPSELPPVKGISPTTGKEISFERMIEEPLSALAFKTVFDRHGDLTFLRVYSGVLKSGAQVYNASKSRPERVMRLMAMHADDRENIDQAVAGEIAVAVGLKHTDTGDTLCVKHRQLILESMAFPATVISMAVEPKSQADRDRLSDALGKLVREDPTFEVAVDEETGQTLINGMGELHLEIMAHRLMRDFKLDVKVGKPRVAYRETVGAEASYTATFDKTYGNREFWARVTARVTPTDAIKPEVVLSIGRKDVPREFLPAIAEGAKGASSGSGEFGYPLIRLRAEITAAEFQAERSNETAFAAAAAAAVEGAVRAAGTVLLEPVMLLSVYTPGEFLGPVTGDLNLRRVAIADVALEGDLRVIKGRVPLASMFGYSTQLRSLTQGRATFTLEPCAYAPVPDEVAAKLGF